MSRDYDEANGVTRAAIRAFLRGRLGAARLQMLESHDALTVSATREDDGWRFFVGAHPPTATEPPTDDGMADEQRGPEPVFLMSLFLADDADAPAIDRLNPALRQSPTEADSGEAEFAAFLNSLAKGQETTDLPSASI